MDTKRGTHADIEDRRGIDVCGIRVLAANAIHVALTYGGVRGVDT